MSTLGSHLPDGTGEPPLCIQFELPYPCRMGLPNTTTPTSDEIRSAMSRGDLDVPGPCQPEFPEAAAAFAKLGVSPESLAGYCRDAAEAASEQDPSPAAKA